MMDEFTTVIKQDLNIGDDESEGSQEQQDYHEEKALLKQFGINTDVFDQTISMFTETSGLFERSMAGCVESMLQEND